MIVWALAATAIVVGRVPRWPVRATTKGGSTVADFARLLAIATAAGLPLGAAIEAVAEDLDGPLADAVAEVRSISRTAGLSAALLGCDELGALGPVLARAHATGSPLGPPLDSFLAAESTRQVTAAQGSGGPSPAPAPSSPSLDEGPPTEAPGVGQQGVR